MLHELDDGFPPRKHKAIPRGILIDEVEKDSPASRAGVRAGDILVEMDGAIIAGFKDLDSVMPGLKTGVPTPIKVYRTQGVMDVFNGKTQDSSLPKGRYVDLEVIFEKGE